MPLFFNKKKMIEMVQLEIIPSRNTHNKKVHELFRAMSSFYISPIESLRGQVPVTFWWDVMISQDAVQFYATLPRRHKEAVIHLINNTWEHASIEEMPFQTLLNEASDVCELKYRRSNIFALQTDRRTEIEPLNSLLSVSKDLTGDEVGRYSICVQPINRVDWQDWSKKQFDGFKEGKTPKRTKITTRDVVLGFGEFVISQLQSVLDIVHTATGGGGDKDSSKKGDYDKRQIMIDGDLSRGTINKMIAPTFNTYIRIAAYSPYKNRQTMLMRTMANSFSDLTADNELERSDYHSKIKPVIVRELNTYRISWPTRFDADKNKMSNEEIGRLVETPTADLQDKYGQISALAGRQLEIPAALCKGGILLGEVAYRKQEIPIYMPINDHDQLCLPTVVIGGMGSGKTKGFACSRAVQFVEQGFSAVVVDPAKGEVWEQLERRLPADKRKRVLLGKDIISLDFREVMHSPSARARLAQILFGFFETNTEEAGAQTQRFLRAAVMGMRTGRLDEILKILTDTEYRESIIEKMKTGINKDTLQQYHKESDARQRQIASPIYNRLDLILGDPYLEKCMEASNGIDMVEVLDRKGVVTVFDVPDSLNTRIAKDMLINLISFKIDAAMGLRKNNFPVAIIYDEPHQYLRSAKLWENVAVESRKYKLAYTWLFHSWEQLPRSLGQIIKDAGPHYVLYPSSKQTYKGLQEEIAPYTLEDGLNTKRYHAIVALRVGEGRLTPLMCRMVAPFVGSGD